MTVRHLDGCPKVRKPEIRLRTFRRQGDWFEATTERCMDCGARKSGKAKKVST